MDLNTASCLPFTSCFDGTLRRSTVQRLPLFCGPSSVLRLWLVSEVAAGTGDIGMPLLACTKIFHELTAWANSDSVIKEK